MNMQRRMFNNLENQEDFVIRASASSKTIDSSPGQSSRKKREKVFKEKTISRWKKDWVSCEETWEMGITDIATTMRGAVQTICLSMEQHFSKSMGNDWHFILNQAEWKSIKPTRQKSNLQGKWAELYSRKFQDVSEVESRCSNTIT